MIRVFSTGCPKCKLLINRLNEKNIKYTLITDIEVMEHLGIENVPVLEINNTLLSYAEAMKWAKEYNNGNN